MDADDLQSTHGYTRATAYTPPKSESALGAVTSLTTAPETAAPGATSTTTPSVTTSTTMLDMTAAAGPTTTGPTTTTPNNRRDVSLTEKDPFLGNGWGYFVEDTGYHKVLKGYQDQDKVH